MEPPVLLVDSPVKPVNPRLSDINTVSLFKTDAHHKDKKQTNKQNNTRFQTATQSSISLSTSMVRFCQFSPSAVRRLCVSVQCGMPQKAGGEEKKWNGGAADADWVVWVNDKSPERHRHREGESGEQAADRRPLAGCIVSVTGLQALEPLGSICGQQLLSIQSGADCEFAVDR